MIGISQIKNLIGKIKLSALGSRTTVLQQHEHHSAYSQIVLLALGCGTNALTMNIVKILVVLAEEWLWVEWPKRSHKYACSAE